MIRQVFKRMYRVYAHIYCHHYPVIRELGLEAHLNTSFKHYVLFIDEHNLASGKDFWALLEISLTACLGMIELIESSVYESNTSILWRFGGMEFSGCLSSTGW